MDQPIPLSETERQAGDRQSWKARGNLGPKDGILHQIVNTLPVAHQVFLGYWTPGGLQPHISSPEETQGTPEVVFLWPEKSGKPNGWGQGGD